jgi:23S rRNA (cytidine1920-2'-O)/16S rRNA (cytidine1409-2'-O)-methyltransferase
VGKGQVGSGGIVRDESQRRAVTEKVISAAGRLGLKATGVLDSPVRGRKGNQEILVSFVHTGIISSSESRSKVEET